MSKYPEPLKTARCSNINEIIINLDLREVPPFGLIQFDINLDTDALQCCDRCDSEGDWLVVEFKTKDGYRTEEGREVSVWCDACLPEEFREHWNNNPQNPPEGFKFSK